MLSRLWQAIKHVGRHKVSFAFSSVGFLFALVLVHLPHGPEHWSADRLTAWLSDRLGRQHPQIVVVEITETEIDRYPFASPMSRRMVADLVATIDQAGASVIGLDIIFDRHSIRPEDEALTALLPDVRAKVVLGLLDDRTELAPSRREFQAKFVRESGRPAGHLHFGERHHDYFAISADVVRTFADGGAHAGETKSFAEQVVEAYRPAPAGATSIASRLASALFPPSQNIAWLLSPSDNPMDTFTSLSATTIMNAAALQLPLGDMMRGKIVLVGGRFLDRDRHLTPLSVVDGFRYSGVFIHAQIVAQKLDRRVVRSLAWWLHAALLIAFVLMGLYAGHWWHGSHHWIEVAVLAGYLAVAVIVFWWWKLILPFMTVFLAFGMGFAGGHGGHSAGKQPDVGHEPG